jgi:hypothetical protein
MRRLWQNRFYSCALDEVHLWTALRYVERDPVRAQLVTRPEDYFWSSAAAHVGYGARPALLDWEFYSRFRRTRNNGLHYWPNPRNWWPFALYSAGLSADDRWAVLNL